jgi:hypothetical protein
MGRKRAQGKRKKIEQKEDQEGKAHGQFENPILHCKL